MRLPSSLHADPLPLDVDALLDDGPVARVRPWWTADRDDPPAPFDDPTDAPPVPGLRRLPIQVPRPSRPRPSRPIPPPAGEPEDVPPVTLWDRVWAVVGWGSDGAGGRA